MNSVVRTSPRIKKEWRIAARPSFLANVGTMNKPLFVGLDVGGTTMKAGVVDDAGVASASVSVPTEAHRGQELGLERMCEAIRQAVAAAGLNMSDIAAIGVATPGTMDIP